MLLGNMRVPYQYGDPEQGRPASSIEELYLRNLASEVVKGLSLVLRSEVRSDGGLASTDLQVDALTWPARARKQGQGGTPTKGGPLVRSSHLTHLGCSVLRACDPCVVGSHEHAR